MKKKLRLISAHLLLAVIVLYIITGFGITQYRFIESITFGLLTKSLSFKIHSNLIYALVVLLLMHLYYSCSIFKFIKK